MRSGFPKSVIVRTGRARPLIDRTFSTRHLRPGGAVPGSMDRLWIAYGIR